MGNDRKFSFAHVGCGGRGAGGGWGSGGVGEKKSLHAPNLVRHDLPPRQPPAPSAAHPSRTGTAKLSIAPLV
jgi:hypothetical protein